MKRWPAPLRILGCALAVLAVGAPPFGASSQTTSKVPGDIATIIDATKYRGAPWGLRVLDGDKVLIDLDSHRKFYVGSVRKIFTVGQLLNAVGPGHTYDTPVYRTGALGRNGVLHGNLIVVASGDLTMGGRTNPDGTISVSDWDHNEADGLGNAVLTKPDPLAGYRRLARAVRAAGITRVAGNVVVDDRLFKAFDFRGQFRVRPIFVNDDVVDLAIPAVGEPGSPVTMNVRPLSAALNIVNKLRVGPPNGKNTLKIDPELPQCIGMPGCAATVSGFLPSGFRPPLTGTPTLVQTVRIVQPSNYARTVSSKRCARRASPCRPRRSRKIQSICCRVRIRIEPEIEWHR